ncbi:uncharacterized protein LOC108815108 [Raphanus sativus]|uniref:Uncharacterized protein LOC108815108 n=1 Tax=Raphanus sativus TaxID=3726 RepID=A0A9W3C5S5_RAPSA|nr:uncharacterized protein LOC108815108 [Raphanus sativus]
MYEGSEAEEKSRTRETTLQWRNAERRRSFCVRQRHSQKRRCSLHTSLHIAQSHAKHHLLLLQLSIDHSPSDLNKLNEAGSASADRVKSKVEIRRRHIKLHRFCICKTRLLVFPQRLLLDSPSQLSIIFFETSNDDGETQLEVASPSLQPFTQDQWKNNQDYFINTARKRAVTIHVAKENGENVEGAVVNVEQISKDFPIGSAISKTILGDLKTYSCYEAEQI